MKVLRCRYFGVETDKAMEFEKPEYLDYLETLSKAAGCQIDTFEDLKNALKKRMMHLRRWESVQVIMHWSM